MGRAWGRLQQRSDFLRAAGQGVRRGTPAFLLQAVSQASHGSLRVGFTASRKIGNAVNRNRAKRRLKAAADAALSGLIAKPVDLVLIARHDSISRDFAAITTELRKTAEQLIRQLDQARPAADTAPTQKDTP